MNLGIEGKVALVCGASRGIGKTCALELAKEGAKAIALARTEKDITHLVKEIREKGGEADFITFDLSRVEAIEEVAKKVKKFTVRWTSWLIMQVTPLQGRIFLLTPSGGSRLFDLPF